MKNGRLIVIEGASDGVGKTTQINLLNKHLIADGEKVASHHFPTYYSYQGKGVEKYLAGEYGAVGELSPYFINTLYAYDRAVTWRIKLKDLYRKGRMILLDRYTSSSLIYQSALIEDKKERREFLDYVIDFEYNKLGIQQPDVVFFLHAPLELVNKMRNERKDNDGVQQDIYERDLDLLKKIYNNAMEVAEYLGWEMVNCATKDEKKMRTPESIHQEIYDRMKGIFNGEREI